MRRSRRHVDTASQYSSQEDLNKLFMKLKERDIGATLQQLPPVPLDGGPLAVGVSIKLVKLQNLDEVVGTIGLVLDMMLCWSDDRLSFDASSESSQRSKIRISPNLVWTPDIVVLNQVSKMDTMFSQEDLPLVLADDTFKKDTGVNVLWKRRVNLESRCEVDMTNFPFDTQHCTITIGSWASSRRQMLLIPQDAHKQIPYESKLHTSEFKVVNITIEKRNVYMRNAAERFEEIRYELVIQRYPHFYILNFMLPMLAVTMLTVATMWMTNAGIRMNSATRLLLCIVQIMNITASWRPANDSDIWLDRFQSHCLALTMGSVLESLIMDYLLKTGIFEISWSPPAHILDTTMRTAICLVTIMVFLVDLCELVQQRDFRALYSSFRSPSSRFLLVFIYLIFMMLGASSVLSFLWLVLPQETWKAMCCKGCVAVAAGGPEKAGGIDDT